MAISNVFPPYTEDARVECEQSPCNEVFVFWVDPLCPACRRLAERIASTSADYRELFWIAAGTAEDIADFASKYNIPEHRMVRLTDRHRRGLSILRDNGIFGVPTRVLLDRNYLVRDIRLSSDLPLGVEVTNYCTGTGFVP